MARRPYIQLQCILLVVDFETCDSSGIVICFGNLYYNECRCAVNSRLYFTQLMTVRREGEG